MDSRRSADHGAGQVVTAEGLLEAAPDAVVISDESGRILLVNARTEDLFGYDRRELVGEHVETLLPETERSAHRAHRAAYLVAPSVRQMSSGRQLAGRRKDGSEFPVDVSLSPLRTTAGICVIAAVRDVTARLEAEQALAERERQYRLLAERSIDVVTRVAPDGTILYVSPACERALGYRPEELVGRDITELAHPDELASRDATSELIDASSDAVTIERRLRHRDGQWCWFEATVTAVRDAENGEVVERQVALRPVDARKQAEAQLVAAQARFRGFFESAPIGEAIVAPDGRFLEVNAALCNLVGFPAEALVGMTFDEITHPDDLAADRAYVRQMLAGEIRTFRMEKRYIHRLGHEVWVDLSVSLIQDEDGAPLYFISQIQDISERKRTELQLAEAERRYRTLIEQLPLGVYVRPLDLSKPNIYCSPQVGPMLGYSATDWETDPGLLAKIVHRDDRERVLNAAGHVRATGEPLHDEYRYVRPDGGIVWVQDETYVVNDDEGNPAYVQGFLLDITERKHAEAERDRLRDRFQETQKLEAVGRLAGGVAHNFNNMLTGIRGTASCCLRGSTRATRCAATPSRSSAPPTKPPPCPSSYSLSAGTNRANRRWST